MLCEAQADVSAGGQVGHRRIAFSFQTPPSPTRDERTILQNVYATQKKKKTRLMIRKKQDVYVHPARCTCLRTYFGAALTLWCSRVDVM